MATFSIRKARRYDIQAIINVIADIWPDCEQVETSFPDEIADMFSNARYRPTFFVAEQAGSLIGVAAWNWGWHNYDMYEFFWGSVRKPFRRMGVGAALMQARLDDIRLLARPNQSQFVTISTHLESHFSKFGFRTIVCMPSIINTGETTTHLMMLEIKPSSHK